MPSDSETPNFFFPPGSIRHEPDWYVARQRSLHDLQRNCWGYHPPEHKEHSLCDPCFVEVCRATAATERDRAASFVESQGFPELAAKIRALP